jgi:hypothetical protein
MLHPCQWVHMDPWCSLQHFCHHCARCWLPWGMRTITCIFFSHFQFLPFMSWHWVHQIWNPRLSWQCHNWLNTCKSAFPILHNSRICYFQCSSNQKNELLRLTPHRSIHASSNWNIWMSTQIGRCVLTQMCQCYLELKKAKRPSLFCLGYFSWSKKFNYIAKDASILHLKSNNNNRPSYFPISTPWRHNPHSYSWFITSHWLLRWRIFYI